MESAHLFLGMKIISWLVGFGIFYLFIHFERAKKSLLAQEVVSQLINFILFMWVGKIILNLSGFIESPLAILAYPSNAQSFYLATFLTLAVIGYKKMRRKDVHAELLESFMFVFLSASFAYEIFQFLWDKHQTNLHYLLFLAILILIYLLIQNRTETKKLGSFMLMGWTVSGLGIYTVKPLFIVFGYTIAPWFLVVILFGSLVYLFFNQRKKVL